MGRDDDVWVQFDEDWWPGVVEKVEASDYVRCRVRVDPEHDFGSSSARIAPEQTVAVRSQRIKPRTQERHDDEES